MHLKQSDFGITTNDLKVPVNIVNLEIKVFSHQSRDAATASLKSSRVLNYSLIFSERDYVPQSPWQRYSNQWSRIDGSHPMLPSTFPVPKRGYISAVPTFSPHYVLREHWEPSPRVNSKLHPALQWRVHCWYPKALGHFCAPQGFCRSQACKS